MGMSYSWIGEECVRVDDGHVILVDTCRCVCELTIGTIYFIQHSHFSLAAWQHVGFLRVTTTSISTASPRVLC